MDRILVDRRRLFGFMAAPAIVHFGNLMPISVPWTTLGGVADILRKQFGEGFIYFGPDVVRMLPVGDADTKDYSRLPTLTLFEMGKSGPIVGQSRRFGKHDLEYRITV